MPQIIEEEPDGPDVELLSLLKRSLGMNQSSEDTLPLSDTGVLRDAEFVCDNSIDVAIDMHGTKSAAAYIWAQMRQRGYSTASWSEHELHPKARDENTVQFIFVMDLLNFCFWSESGSHERFAIRYAGKVWTGYNSLTAALQRGIAEGVPILEPSHWTDEHESRNLLSKIFRSATDEQIPLFEERVACLVEAGQVMEKKFDSTFLNCIAEAKNSAVALVNLLADNFPCFRDEVRFQGRTVRFMKRAQILVADLWACFDGESYGKFYDIDKITMFADYRLPQMLHTLGCLTYSPPLESWIRQRRLIEPGHDWEIQLRGCSIWCVELLRREILRQHPGAKVNTILIDFFLYDTMKEMEASGKEHIPHHRTRSIWY